VSEALSKLVELIVACWRMLVFWAVLDTEHVGFIRRLGVPRRDAKPGLNWKWPLIERLNYTVSSTYTVVCDPQSLTSKDGVSVVVRVTAKCWITDARTYYLNAQDGKSDIQDVLSGHVGWLIPRMTCADVLKGRFLHDLAKRAGTDARQWGIRIYSVGMVDSAKSRSFRVWQNQITSSGQE
jgi:regulator of protease activity HflC (stomatin/prohibitin superfamily)